MMRQKVADLWVADDETKVCWSVKSYWCCCADYEKVADEEY